MNVQMFHFDDNLPQWNCPMLYQLEVKYLQLLVQPFEENNI